MTTDELEEYLRIVVDMEKSVYMQERTFERMNQEKDMLGIRRKIAKPKPSVEAKRGVLIKLGLAFVILLTLILGIGLGIPGIGILGVGLLNLDNETLGWRFIYIVIGLLLLGGAVKLWDISHEAIIYLGQCRKAKLMYEKAIDEYKEDIRADKKRVKEELICRECIIENLQKLEDLHKSTVWRLEKIYEKI